MATGATVEPADSSDLIDRAGMGLILTLCMVSFLGGLHSIALSPFLPVVAGDLHSTVPLVGQTITAMLLFGAAVGLVAGPIADYYGHRRVLAIGLITLITSSLGTALATNYIFLFAIRLVGGVSSAILAGLTLAIIGIHLTGDARRKAMSWVVASIAGAAIAGIPMLTTIGQAFGWRAAFLAMTVSAAIGLFFVLRVLPPDASASRGEFRLGAVLASYRPLVGDQPTLLLFGGTALRTLCFVGFLTYMGAFLIQQHGVSLSGAGLVYMIAGAGYFAGSLVAGGRLGRFNLRLLTATTMSAMGLFWGLAYLLPSATGVGLAVVAITLAALLGGINWVALTGLLIDQSPGTPATTMLFNGSMFNLGSAGGGAVGGLLLGLGGFDALGIGLPVFAVASGLLALLSGKVATAAVLEQPAISK